MWTHGTDLHVEVDANVESIRRFGFFTRVVGKPNTTNWYHFADPHASDRQGQPARASAGRCFDSSPAAPSAVVRDVHIYDGRSGSPLTSSSTFRGNLPFAVFGVPTSPTCSGAPGSRSE